jgi:hypothetical protein
MAPALPLLLALALGLDGRVETGIRTEVRGRRIDPAPTPSQGEAVDLSATPRLVLSLLGAGATLSASYAPRLTAADVGPDARFEYMHEGELRLRLDPDAVWHVEAFANGGLGRTDLVTENRTATGGPSTVSTLGTIDVGRLRTGLSLRVLPARRAEFLLSGAFSVDGGSDDASRAVYPVARSVESAGELRWSATRLDQVGLRLAGAGSRVSDRQVDAAGVCALATWRHHASPQVEIWGEAGAVALQSRAPVAPGSPDRRTLHQVRPAGELGLSRHAPVVPVASDPSAREATAPAHLVTGELVADLGASVDRLTGMAEPELDVRAALRWPVARHLEVVGSGAGSLAWPETGQTRRGQLELWLSLALTPRASLDLGGYGAWQSSSDPSTPSFGEYGAFLSLTLDAPPLTF